MAHLPTAVEAVAGRRERPVATEGVSEEGLEVLGRFHRLERKANHKKNVRVHPVDYVYDRCTPRQTTRCRRREDAAVCVLKAPCCSFHLGTTILVPSYVVELQQGKAHARCS